MSRTRKIYRVDHEEPGSIRWDYILLPYGEYYKKTACLLEAKPGDTLRFFQGRDADIMSVCLIEDSILCTVLCRIRYGISWMAALDRWRRYAVLEGHGKDIFLNDKCILVTFKYRCQENK